MSNIAQSSLSPSLNAAVVVYVPGAGKDEELRPPGGVAATEKGGRRKLEAGQGGGLRRKRHSLAIISSCKRL